MPDLASRPCVVTGAGRGIGRVLAEHLASSEAPLGICARSAAELDDAATALRAAGAPEVLARVVDVADAEGVSAFADECASTLGPVYAVVNNAAVLGPVGRIDHVDPDAWRRAVVTNVAGVMHTARAFVPQMASRGAGRIVNLSGGGIGGPGVAPNVSAYTSSKGAVAVLTESLATELAGLGITVNAIAPGAQPTAFVEEIVQRGPAIAGDDLYDVTVRQQSAPLDLVPFLELVDFVLSDDAAWLRGRLLSARWDPVPSLVARRSRIEGSSLLTLRRIDDDLYDDRSTAEEGS